MLPATLLQIAAPIVAQKIADGFTGNTPPPPTEAATPPDGDNILREIMDHEKSKASVRPAMMRASGNVTIASALCYIFAAFAPMFFDSISLEHSTHAMEALLYVMGGGAGLYGYTHTVRSVEKAKGAA